MRSLDLESFADIYVSVALEAAGVNDSPTLDDFYKYICGKVSDRTDIPEEGIRYVHHAFHWVLFLKNYSPLEITHSQGINGLSRVRLKSNPLEKSELVSCFLSEHRTWLEERMKNIKLN